jgi:serine/threonine protein kinase
MKPGQLLCDRYRVEKALAAGGFGETFLAVDTHLPSKPQVVVKLLKPINNDPATLKIAQRLFNTEAETLEKLGKDNDRIPSLYAYFELRGEFYLVQEYIAGTTLTGELQGRKILESDTLDILKEILTGLTKVHSQNIIHRDLKPDNIIRRGIDRKLVLIDFGAVKQVRAATVTTPNPAISRTIGIGTEGYMPSEQGIGYPKPASDIYAVGAIAIQCLTGSAPHLLFDEDSLKLEWQHLRKVNPDLAQVLNKMVATDYRQRYANATEALRAIESLISLSAPAQIPSPPIPIPIPTPVIPTVPTKPVVRSPPPQPVKSPINQGRKPPSPKPIQEPVNKQVKPPSRGIDRRVFLGNSLKWLGFVGVGTVSFFVLNQGVITTTGNNKPAPETIGALAVVPTGTIIDTNLQQELTTDKSHSNEKFTIKVKNGSLDQYPAFKDATIEGHLENVVKAGKGKKATLNLFFDDIKLKNGDILPIHVALVNVQVETKTKGQFLKNEGIILGGTIAGHFLGDQANFKHGKLADASAATAFMMYSPDGEVVLKKGTDLQLKLKSNLDPN